MAAAGIVIPRLYVRIYDVPLTPAQRRAEAVGRFLFDEGGGAFISAILFSLAMGWITR